MESTALHITFITVIGAEKSCDLKSANQSSAQTCARAKERSSFFTEVAQGIGHKFGAVWVTLPSLRRASMRMESK